MHAEVRIRRRPKRRRVRVTVFMTLLLIAVLAVAGGWYVMNMPSTERVAPFDGRKNVIVYNGEVSSHEFRLVEGQILLPFNFVKDTIDEHIFWDEPSNSVIVTTKEKVLQMESNQVVAFLNKVPVDLRVPVQEIDGIRYIPYAPLEQMYQYTINYVADTGVLVVEKMGEAIQQGKVASTQKNSEEPIPLRTGSSHKQPIVADIKADELIDIFAEDNQWFKVQSSTGIIGFLPKQNVTFQGIRQTAKANPEQSAKDTAWKPLGKPINLTWEQVVSRNPQTSSIPDMPGLNVISPTWFELIDDQANLANRADTSYVNWAHQRGYKVWALVSNGFNPDWTQAMLADYRMREKMSAQIINYVAMYKLDGINLDFENVYIEDKERLVQFVRELTPYLHEQGLTVSMDVTFISTSDRWSRFYDRVALAEVVDYIAVMAYDEHWAASPIAGSVASLPWVESGLQAILEEVPNHKLLLGMPFYTRLWKEEKQADGSVKVSSKALSMPTAESWVAERNLAPKLDEKSGQMFVSYVDPTDGATYKMWLEDAGSLAKRVELVHKYNLAGVASWRRGFEQPHIWSAINEELSKPN